MVAHLFHSISKAWEIKLKKAVYHFYDAFGDQDSVIALDTSEDVEIWRIYLEKYPAQGIFRQDRSKHLGHSQLTGRFLTQNNFKQSNPTHPMHWYIKVWKQYADFDGRARRTEYWMFSLFHILAIVAAILLDSFFGIAIDDSGIGPLYIMYLLASIIPSFAVNVRRLHDVGKSGWMLLISIIPLVGAIWLLVLDVSEGDSGRNEYGKDPKMAV